MTGRPGRQQEKCALTSAGSAGFASKRRTDSWSSREQRDQLTAGIAGCRDRGLSFIHNARMGRAYGKCLLRRETVYWLKILAIAASAGAAVPWFFILAD